MPKTTREVLHNLVDQLPEFTWDEVNLILLECLEEGDEESVLYDPLAAPEVEPTVGEVAAVEEAYTVLRTGQVKLMPHEEVVKRLMELP